MLRPAIRSARLTFGGHDTAFEFPDIGRPVLVAGPNGSGKTTLVEGVLRTLFGFERRRGDDAARLEVRRPWSGAAMAGEVTLVVAGETIRVRRDFATARVRVESGDGLERFDGDGNPGASNHEARQYRSILGDILGVTDLESYRRTLFVTQGGLPSTVLGEHLLRVAAGGHAQVDAARDSIAEQHRDITRRALQPGARAAVNPRELEKLEDEIASLHTRLAMAREAAERRGPLTTERERTAARLQELDEQIRQLEDARSVLARSDVVELEARHVREWSRRLDRSADLLRRRAEEVDAAAAALNDSARGGMYPADFQERLARVDVRWAELRSLEGRPPRWLAVLGIGTLLAGAALVPLGLALPGAITAGLGAVVTAFWTGLRLDAVRRRRRLNTRIRRDLEGVPAAGTVTSTTRDRHLARFLGQRSASRRLEEARWDLAEAMRDGRALLREGRAMGLPRSSVSPDRQRLPATWSPAVRRLADQLLAAGEQARDRLARGQYELERVGDASLNLPDGVAPTETGVTEALEARRTERTRAQQELQQIAQDLLERGTPADSVAALEAALADLVPRRDALRTKARILEAGHALVTDAYDAFRDHDQERLVSYVSGHVQRLTADRVGPVMVEDSLEDARLRMNGRVVPMASPPLSFGEYHALLLSVRLGAADFLGGIGLLPPLVIDEPFVHMDSERVEATWALLSAVASERQVIVTTQDELRVKELGVKPDIHLQRND